MKHIPFFLLPLLFLAACSAGQQDLSDLVYPQMDSAHSRWAYFASACRPFGMVALSPDTDEGDDWIAGYRYNSPSIQGISHIHCWQISGVSVMPVTFSEGAQNEIFTDCSSPFSHEGEVAKVGYHRLLLERYGVQVELASTNRTGFHRYSFSDGGTAEKGVLLNLTSQVGPCWNRLESFTQTGSSSFEGMVVSEPTIRRPKPFNVYFRIELDQPVTEVEKQDGKVLLHIAKETGQLNMKVALSYTSEENAGINMQAENPGWDFDAVVTDAKQEWNGLLGRVELEGSEADVSRFYTDLWHVLLGKHTISDVNGYYPDNTGAEFTVRRLPLRDDGTPAFRHFNTDGFWGGNCAFDNIWLLLYPDISREHVMSMMQYYKDGGLFPRGPSGANYSYVMTGDCNCAFVVSAVLKGIVTEDLEEIYQALRKNHEPGGIMEKTGYEHYTSTGGGFPYYLSMGYVPYPNPVASGGFHQQGAGLTLQYAYEDYALAQLALKLGKTDDYERYMARALNYRNVYDAESGWMRPKDVDGRWMDPFDPYDYANGFIEANAAQATWYVPHDAEGLAELMGGKAAAAEKLNACMEAASAMDFTSGKSHNVETEEQNKRIPINYGNQPSIHTAFVFHYFDRPNLSQYWSHRIVRAVYSEMSPEDGYNGDEDQGSMSCLAVAMKIGLFQADGGVRSMEGASATGGGRSGDGLGGQRTCYQIGSPIFSRITLHLSQPDGTPTRFVISCKGDSDASPVVKSARLNGRPYRSSFLAHDDLVRGGRLVLEF